MGSPETSELKPGRSLGHYRIVRHLGAGGMGEVYLAEDTRLERRVAVKILPAELAQNPDRMGRFIREAKAASNLNHPHIAHIYEIGESDGVNFIAMEYVDGVTLRDKIHKEREPLRTLLKYLQQVAEGLSKAHSKGIIHRDLKPDNVIISRDGYAKVLDFGLAKHVDSDGFAGEPQSDAKTVQMHAALSTPGTIMGTAGYMSPEQARGAAKIDQRSDIFAFGCLLYEAATGGRQAFPGETAVDSMYKILHSQPAPVSEFNPAAPQEIQRVIRRCLQKDPDDRYQTVKDVAIEIREMLEAMKGAEGSVPPAAPSGNHGKARATVADHGKWTGEGAVTVPSDPAFTADKGTNEHEPVRRRRSAGMKALAAGIVLAAVGGLSFGVYQLTRPGRGGPESGNLRVTPLTSSLTVERSPALSSDGKTFAYVWAGDKGEDFDIYVKLTDAGSPVRVTSNPGRDMSPSISPDGRFIAFLRGDGADKGFYVVPSLGGAERKVADTFGWAGGSVRAQAVDWSPDGKSIAIVDKQSDAEPWSVYAVSVDSGLRRRITTPPPDHDGDMLVAFSPGGESIAFQRRRDASTSDIYVVPVSGGEPVRVTSDGVAIRGFDWTNDGERIVFSSERGGGNSTLWSIESSGGEPHPVAGAGENVAELTVASAANRLAYAQISTDINLWRAGLPGAAGPSGQPPARFNASNRSEIDPHYSPSGDKVVFSSNRSGGSEIWVCDADGGNAVQITNFGTSAVTGSPRWSPDGRQIAFDSRAGGNSDVYIVGAGGGTPRRLTEDTSEEVVPSWSADGRFVYFASRKSGRLEIWKSPADGGEAVQVTRGGGFIASESPDGKILFFTKGGNDAGIWSLSLESGEEKKIIEAPVGRNWSAVPRGIYYVLSPSADGEPYTLHFYDTATRQTAKPTPVQGTSRLYPMSVVSVSADERWIVWAQRDLLDFDVMLLENFR